jgi:hypothetical protein
VHFALVTHGEFELPEYLRGPGLPERILRSSLTVVMVRKGRREFAMPTDV